VLFNLSKYVGTAFQTSFSYFSYKKSKQKNFPPTTPIYFGKAFEDSQETFPEKFLVSGSHGRCPNIQYTQKNKMFPDKKSENTLLFIFLGENLCERPAG